MSDPVLSVRESAGRVPDPARHADRGGRVSFDIAPGEVLGVVGESGAGKSLTGAAIIGLIEPPGRIAGGEVRLGGERIDGLPAEAMRRIRGKGIGMVFQDPLTSLNPLYASASSSSKRSRPTADLGGRGARSARSRCCGGRHPGAGAAHRQLSAPVLRRHAPAGGARAGAGGRAAS